MSPGGSAGIGRIPDSHPMLPLIPHTAPHVHHHHYTSSPVLQVTLVRPGVRGHLRRSFQHHLLSTCLTIIEDPAYHHRRPQGLMYPLLLIAFLVLWTTQPQYVLLPKSRNLQNQFAHHHPSKPNPLRPLRSSRAGCQLRLKRR